MSTTPGLIAPLATDAARQAEGSCPACAHPATAHDALAQRFCAATRAGDLHRGCLCSTESGSATYGKPGRGNVSDRA
ncbi:RGCVC family protein [Saccharothrix sp. S26]|uniref:RGCVC family protein n=1 Tax=Saccharothrix sp. S26 TaxID=2907215 RepID=UPI001F2540C8|nr:RGCVC family protein [Saccharothrix sp. S26]MCE6996185.1 RGCVC family protein [Saccharothrix sp. S26]